MNTLELFAVPSPLKSETAEIRQIVHRLARSLCHLHGIQEVSDELVISFGVLSDKDNSEAVSSWIYQQIKSQSYSTQEELLRELVGSFEQKLDAPSNYHAGG